MSPSTCRSMTSCGSSCGICARSTSANFKQRKVLFHSDRRSRSSSCKVHTCTTVHSALCKHKGALSLNKCCIKRIVISRLQYS